jgi:hypothetical protein
VQAALLGSNFSQQLGDIQTKGQQKAYEDAYRQFTDQAARQRARASDLQGLGLTRFQTGLAEQGLGQKLAQADRAEAQSELDKAFKEYTEQEQYPESELAQLSSFVYGNPFLQTPDRTTTQSAMLQPTSSVGQGLLGLGLTGLNIYGRAGGFGPGGPSLNTFFNPYGKKYGGRVVQRQEGGEVPNIYNNPQASPARGGLSQLGEPVGSGFLGGLFGRIVPRRQTNVIENIDNAAGSLNDYKEAMDENMLNLRRASAGISRTYNQTFGPMQGRGIAELAPYVQRIMAQRPGFGQINELEKADTFGMKAGGGLGSLPVIKRQVGGDLDFEYDLEDAAYRARTTAPLPSRPQMQTSGLSNIQRFIQQNPKFKEYIEGGLAERQATELSKLQKEQIERLKKAMPQQDRFAGLAEAAKRVMGADPSKGFINALVQGMSGLDEGQREAYLKQKEQELKLLELEQEGEIKALERKQSAEEKAATAPLKLAQLSKALKGTYRKFDSTVQKTLQDAAEKELGLQAQIINGEVVSIKNRDGKDATEDDLRKFNRLFSKLVTGFARFDKTSDSAAEALSQTLRIIPGLKIPKATPSSGQDDAARTPLPATSSKTVKKRNSQNLVTSS